MAGCSTEALHACNVIEHACLARHACCGCRAPCLTPSLGARCHRCLLAARSDYFRALLERSPNPEGPHRVSSDPEQRAPLPEAAIGGIGPDAFEVVLRFVYTDSIAGACRWSGRGAQGKRVRQGARNPRPGGASAGAGEQGGGSSQRLRSGSGGGAPAHAEQGGCSWLTAERAEELLYAADLFLLFGLKVGAPLPAQQGPCLIHPIQHPFGEGTRFDSKGLMRNEYWRARLLSVVPEAIVVWCYYIPGKATAAPGAGRQHMSTVVL